ncbi:Twin-arginine leader-binding protein DmsD [Cedecea neteri]|uniref:Tat proofreading chaperone DmsD n=1 Tax=Cedecea neteri TaxID=158822 RepID=A0A291DYX4_9ENTR|nr:Tat proofreading chaperone DmsD [Cedecea neteri]ATF92879.1 Tat proofreading chaperone DmsD [Cedecea neteri]SQC93332.1 Twin-arginine leader-binding protein DmsD [Cedecea neteri]
MTSEQQRLSAVALSGRVLGALFYHAPDHPDSASLMAMLAAPDWVSEWPFQTPTLALVAPLMAAGLADQNTSVNEEFQRLFIGPYALPAPPWGSVYLDKENVLFGDSMLELRQWMREQGFAPQTEQNEPEDHFGLMLMLAAWLADQGLRQQLDELLAWHLLPWAERYLSLFTENAANDFYRGLGGLAKLTLSGWQNGMLMPVASKELHF